MIKLFKFWLNRQLQPKTLYLIRGLPGTGKTTLSESLTPWNVAADMLPGLYNSDGSYNLHLQPHSHLWCYEQVEKWMEQQKSKIAVHNTFVLQQWIEPYEKLALIHGYRFQVIHCEGEHGSIHNVPEEMIEKWRETWEPYKLK